MIKDDPGLYFIYEVKIWMDWLDANTLKDMFIITIIIHMPNYGWKKKIKTKLDKIYGTRALRHNLPRKLSWKPTGIFKVRQILIPQNYSTSNATYSGATGRLVTNTADSFFSLNFQIGDLGQISTFSAMFDQYRIHKVIVRLFPLFQQAVISSTAVQSNPRILYFKDKDDSVVPTTLAQMRERGNCVDTMQHLSRPTVISLTPSYAVDALGGGVAAPVVVGGKDWMDLATTNTEHYGLKFGFPAQGATAQYQYDVSCTYEVEFQNVR